MKISALDVRLNNYYIFTYDDIILWITKTLFLVGALFHHENISYVTISLTHLLEGNLIENNIMDNENFASMCFFIINK